MGHDKHKEKKYKYRIPKTASINANIDYIDNNNVKFDIYRWIKMKNKNNNDHDNNSTQKLQFAKNKDFVPFSIGSRDCPGREFAEKELYSFLANLMVNYKFSLMNKNEKITYKREFVKRIDPQIPVLVKQRP